MPIFITVVLPVIEVLSNRNFRVQLNFSTEIYQGYNITFLKFVFIKLCLGVIYMAITLAYEEANLNTPSALYTLQWPHHERDSVSNHQRPDCLPVCSGADQRKHQRPASLAFVRGIHRWPVDSPHKGSVTRKMCSFDDVIMRLCLGVIYMAITALLVTKPTLNPRSALYRRVSARKT